ncbi:hypothetical protein G7Y79_00017g042990 [Physcia stellaris]|nr:hypothetical protein G7Y79_00017g042990 [Physcia stellaris]
MMSSSTERKPARISVTLLSDSLVLDLKRGFSKNFGICIRNDESKPITLYFPGLQKGKGTYTSYDFIEGLHKGVFQFQHGESGESFAFDNLKQAHTMTSEPAQVIIYAGGCLYSYVLTHRPEGLNNIGLQAGEDYLVHFAHASQRIKCKFSERREDGTPEPFSASDEQNDLVDISCGGGPIKIRVVQDVPIPRFQLSFHFTSSICSMSGSPPFALKLSLKYLGSRPVTLNMFFSPWDGLQGLYDLIKLIDTATGKEVELRYVSWCFDGQPMATPDDFEEFNEGTEYNREWIFGAGPDGDIACLESNRTYVAELIATQFPCWQYGTKADVLGIMDSGHQVGGPIQPEMFEAAPSFANIIENIFEREQAGPFFRLPRELRDQIYGNLKSSNPSRRFFRTDAGSGSPEDEESLPID